MMSKNLQTTWKMGPVLDVNVVSLTKHSLIESNILTVTGTAQIRIIEKMKPNLNSSIKNVNFRQIESLKFNFYWPLQGVPDLNLPFCRAFTQKLYQTPNWYSQNVFESYTYLFKSFCFTSNVFWPFQIGVWNAQFLRKCYLKLQILIRDTLYIVYR